MKPKETVSVYDDTNSKKTIGLCVKTTTGMLQFPEGERRCQVCARQGRVPRVGAWAGDAVQGWTLEVTAS